MNSSIGLASRSQQKLEHTTKPPDIHFQASQMGRWQPTTACALGRAVLGCCPQLHATLCPRVFSGTTSCLTSPLLWAKEVILLTPQDVIWPQDRSLIAAGPEGLSTRPPAPPVLLTPRAAPGMWSHGRISWARPCSSGTSWVWGHAH